MCVYICIFHQDSLPVILCPSSERVKFYISLIRRNSNCNRQKTGMESTAVRMEFSTYKHILPSTKTLMTCKILPFNPGSVSEYFK